MTFWVQVISNLMNIQNQTGKLAHLKRHELVVGFRSPSVDLNTVSQSHSEELDSFMFH